MTRIDQIRKGMIMAAPSGERFTRDKAAAHSERLPILELEEIHPISAVTRQRTVSVMTTSLFCGDFDRNPDVKIGYFDRSHTFIAVTIIVTTITFQNPVSVNSPQALTQSG
jgi:hypothetical protein